MKKMVTGILVIVLLASFVPLAVTPAAAYEEKIPMDADENDELTKDELVNAILPYMLDRGDFTLDDVGDAAWVYAHWDGVPKTIVDQGGQDITDRTVTIYRPVERIVALSSLPELRSLKAAGKVVAVSSYNSDDKTMYPDFFGFPVADVGSLESIIALRPDVAMLSGWSTGAWGVDQYKIDTLESAGITVFRTATNTPQFTAVIEGCEKIGRLLDKEDEADEFIDFYGGWLNSIKEVVDELPEENKPKVYCQHCVGSMRKAYWPYSGSVGAFGHGYPYISKLSGGKSIFSDVPFSTVSVNVEEVKKRDPEILIWCGAWGAPYDYGSYDRDAGDITAIKAVRDEVMNRDVIRNTTAVENREVYVFNSNIYCCGGLYFVGLGYLAKIFHPTLFEDLDPKAIHQEYLTRFQGLDIDLDEQGVFVYHPEHFPDGQ